MKLGLDDSVKTYKVSNRSSEKQKRDPSLGGHFCCERDVLGNGREVSPSSSLHDVLFDDQELSNLSLVQRSKLKMMILETNISRCN